MSFFWFKERVEDFIVEEMLEKEPTGRGDYHYIFFEKKNLATFELMRKLQDEFGFNRNMIGIAWLKDKQGVTRQWLSFLKRDVQKHCQGINNLLAFLRKTGKVVHATYGEKMLKLGVNKWNTFHVILRSLLKKDYEKMQQAVETVLSEVKVYGLPNYFWPQRFGHRGNNWQTGEKLVKGEIRSLKWDNNTLVEKRFKVQAFASYVFNTYLDLRISRGKLWKLLPGDVIIPADGRYTHWKEGERDNTEKINITWPVIGDDLAHGKDAALKLEEDAYKMFELPKNIEQGFKKFGLFGIRRAILIYPENLTWKWTKDRNLMLSFELPSGAYASVLVDVLEQKLWEMLW